MSRISSEEFYHWMVLEQIEPFGERAEYIRAGMIASTFVNVHRDPKKEPLNWKDFFPWFDNPVQPKPAQTWQEQAAMFAALLDDEVRRQQVLDAIAKAN